MDCLQQAAIHKRDQLCTSVPDRTLNQISAGNPDWGALSESALLGKKPVSIDVSSQRRVYKRGVP